jgi:hypothetical protein
MENKFSDKVSESIGNYVYRLIDPRNGETFYVGKGRGNRVFQHAADEIKFSNSDSLLSEKLDRIKEIRNQGLEVLHVIHRHGIPDASVFEVEATLIDAYPGLSNEQSGHGSSDRGPMNAFEIINKYDLPELDFKPKDKLVLININRIENKASPQSILSQVEYSWKININQAKKADFVLAVERGVVIGVFNIAEWLPAIAENFPGRTDSPGRYGFKGYPASHDVWEYYVSNFGKRIVNPDMKHFQNPIRYWNIT